MGQYEVCTTEETLDDVVAATSGQGTEDAPFAFGRIEKLEVLDAFGAAGRYNRAQLAQLYRGLRVRVVHGWKDDEGRFESVTLISPYPDAALTRINPGTMIIRWMNP